MEKAMDVRGDEAADGCKIFKWDVVFGMGFVGSKGVVGKDFGNQPSELDQIRRIVVGFFVVFAFGNARQLIVFGVLRYAYYGKCKSVGDFDIGNMFMDVHATKHDIVGLDGFLIADGVAEWVSGKVSNTAAAEGVAMCGSAAVGLVLGHKLNLGVVKQ